MNTTLRVLQTLNLTSRRYLSSKKLAPELVVPVGRDMIVCWHPEKEFPYEYSLPVPEQKIPSNSVLCIGEKDIAEVFKHKKEDMLVQDLAKITFTTKHRWYPKNWRKRLRRVDPDRPYL